MSEHNNYEHDYGINHRDRKFAGLSGRGKGSRASQGMDKHERKEFLRELRSFSMFSRCTDHDLEELIGRGQSFTLPANWPMVSMSTPADACYVITEGVARVLRDGAMVAELGRGDVVGEMAVLTGSLRRANVTTASRVSGLRVANDDLLRLFGERPSLLQALRAEFEARAARAGRTLAPQPMSSGA